VGKFAIFVERLEAKSVSASTWFALDP